jgi:cytochrome c553
MLCPIFPTLAAAQATVPDLNQQFADRIAPLVRTYCHTCHGPEKAEAKLNLTVFKSAADVARGHKPWELVLERLEAGEMPPEEAKLKPTAEERKAIVQWVREFRRFEAERNSGDPGPVFARRLNSAEYNYTIRDLTGVDIQPAREFPVDPANEAGFDNSSESLAMSPALANKYVAAARQVAEHLVLTPTGLAFARHPVMTDTDRDKYCVRRIVDFYLRQPTDYADYFEAAWRYRYRAELGQSDARLNEIARQHRISPKYLAIVWAALTEQSDDVGPLAKLQAMFRELPAPTQVASGGRESPDGVTLSGSSHLPLAGGLVRRGCVAMRDYVVELRKHLEPHFKNLDVEDIHDGAQAFVLWKNRQYRDHRRKYDPAALRIAGQTAPPTVEQPADDGEDRRRSRDNRPQREPHPDTIVPADAVERAKYEAAFGRFASIFPDAFYISERGRDYVGVPKEKQEKGRLLSAGFHSMMGYFRDDTPLVELILDERERAELDALWAELDFVASARHRQYQGFLWFERTDSRWLRDEQFDFARAEDKSATEEAKIMRLKELYLAKARTRRGGQGTPIEAIEFFFDEFNSQIRAVEQARIAAGPKHLDALLTLAGRAFRRQLSDADRTDLLAFYRTLREKEQLTHEEAVQDTLVYVLMSPDFCYRLDLAAARGPRRPLTDVELADRLSYFLWSSMPDERLMARAAAGELRQPDVLRAEARRMLEDDRVRGLAAEFAGNWLDFRRFESHNGVDRQRFPSFTSDLRQAMFEEPLRYFIDIAQHDRSVLEFLYGRHTFVNAVLARHYGLDVDESWTDDWVRIDEAAAIGRGGLLPMAAFLTQNSPGLRTSPVKRGYWVVRRVLGERIPPPPPEVPELPADEAKLGELTLREALARHREHASCAACHERFDSLGLVFEGYGPIGERRERDLGGRPVQKGAEFPRGKDGKTADGAGLAGLTDYIRTHRQEDFLDNLCRKLLSYALGRTLLPSDDKLLGEMRTRLVAEDHRFGVLVETIVTSPQFLTKRGNATTSNP